MPFQRPGQKFSVPENDDKIMVSWERFLDGDPEDTDALRRLVDDSWRRCLDASVDPRRHGAPPPMREESLHTLRDACAELLEASAPVMASAREFLSETGTMMVLTNETGVILNQEGDNRVRQAAENVHLLSGATWSEDACGTNAIGTALAVGQPVQIHSSEHFCSGIKLWSCSANVVRDPFDGAILGVVDVSGLSETFSRHTLALVVATAGRIENRLAHLELDNRLRLLEKCMDQLSTSSSDGLIVFDRRGQAIKANSMAPDILAGLARRHEDMPQANAHGSGLDHLRLPWKRGNILPERMPAWAKPEWFTPVVKDGTVLGFTLHLPAVGNRSPAITPLRPGKIAPQAAPTRDTTPASPADANPFAHVVGTSPVLQQAISRARQLARSKAPVLLLGETGVGKDVFAQALHAASAGAAGPFIAINCGGFARELLSSELFGYAEGAFTGARRGGMMGKIEAADGGTLFLDEIGEMPKDLQPHFLRVLESGEVYRIGETRPRRVNFRLIAATNRDLREEIRVGTFRMDLFYRVAVTSIAIPPLRERLEDLPRLCDHLIHLLAQRQGVSARPLSPGTLAQFMAYGWPGNIRELRNTLESMLLLSEGPELDESTLPDDLRTMNANAVVFPDHPQATPGRTHMPVQGEDATSGLTGMESAERIALVRAMQMHKGNVTAVARALGIAKSTVYVKLRRYNLHGVVHDMRRHGGLTTN
ncbi:sigma-54-dependent Fis family transcriptional regulator [Xanthobacter sp. TB0139]|uniref:sigma-54-dependent Fis family transcriptional regulator n=1 Tax=Xanthobacter sp. TB0139 TaxID=3459178 RepID=UPI004039280E